jgi:hypothetical protein
LGIQAKSVLSERIVFNPFGVRFGVRWYPRKYRDSSRKMLHTDAPFCPPGLFSDHFVGQRWLKIVWEMWQTRTLRIPFHSQIHARKSL